MDISVIEDASPFYIRFCYPELQNIIDLCLEEKHLFQQPYPFVNYKLPYNKGKQILKNVPYSKELGLNSFRVSLFITQPGHYYRAHRDGLFEQVSINFPIQILDNKCVTSWYDNSQFDDFEIDTVGNTSRELVGFQKDKFAPIKQMTAKMNECILFNTDLYHDFDNSNSENIRVMLTLRPVQVNKHNFDSFKKALLG
jgi:hypothetical protein